jgi:hypothetical protein
MNIYAILNNQTLNNSLANREKFSYNNNNNPWFNRVYLCYEDTDSHVANSSLPIKGFKCYRYNSFENADRAWNNDRKELHKLKLRVTMIPICEWVPVILDKYILNWKLKNMYWLGEHKVNTGNTRYK